MRDVTFSRFGTERNSVPLAPFMKLAALLSILAFSQFSDAADTTLQLNCLDETTPSKIGEAEADNARLILTVINSAEKKRTFSAFGGVWFEVFDSNGNPIEDRYRREASYPQREDYPVVGSEASHCLCYYAWRLDVEGETYLMINDRRGQMWSFGPTRETQFSIQVRYSAGEQERKKALEWKAASELEQFVEGKFTSNRVALRFRETER